MPRPTTTNQRVLGAAVTVLLTANAFAAAIVAGEEDGARRHDRPEAASSANQAPRTITLITTSDGRRLLVDPSTAAGRRAIAEAQDHGGTTQDVTVPASDGTAAPGSPTAPLDLGQLLGNVAAGAPGAGGVVEIGRDLADRLVQDPAGTLTSIVDGTRSTVTSLVDGAPTTVSSLLGSTQSTVTSLVGSTQSTVTSLVGSTQSTVSSLVGGTQTTVTTVVSQVTPTTSLLGGLITTVTSVVSQTVSPTTTAAPAPTTTAPICVLVLC